MTATITQASDQAAAQQAVDKLTQAIALLNDVASDMNHRAAEGTSIETACAITGFTRVAVRNAELALMNATNELKLAQRAPKERHMNQAPIENIARQITPGLVEEHGNRPNAQTRADYIARWLDQAGIELDDEDFESLMDEVKDLAPTYSLTAS